MNQKLHDYFKKLHDSNKLTQAFLIGNVKFNDVKDSLESVLSDYFFHNDIKISDNSDIIILGEEDENVSKDSIKKLINFLSTTSQFNNCKVYIINNAEKLSDFSYNAILKTLEEPEENIYAFLLSNNIENVKPTIVSRCQKLFISSISSDTVDLEYNEMALKFIDYIENLGIKTIAEKSELYSIIVDREYFKNVLKCILLNYEKSLKDKLNNNESNIICSNNSLESILDKILIINSNIEKMNNYLNKNMCIDHFIIEMWRCSNEKNRS